MLHDKKNRRKLKSAGADDIIYAQELIGQLSREYSGHPIAFEAMHALRIEHNGVKMDEIMVDEKMAQVIKTVKDLSIRSRRIVLLGVMELKTNTFVFNPKEDYKLFEGDMLVVIAEHSMVHDYRVSLHKQERR